MAKDGQNRVVAHVLADGRIRAEAGLLPLVENMNLQVASFLQKYGGLTGDPPAQKLVSGDISTYPITFIRWHGCTALIVLQVSHRATRVLCYLDPRNKLTSQGTDCGMVHSSVLRKVSQVLKQLSATALDVHQTAQIEKKLSMQAARIENGLNNEKASIERQRDRLNAQLQVIDLRESQIATQLREAAEPQNVRMLKGAEKLICREQPCGKLRPDRVKDLFGVPSERSSLWARFSQR